MRKGHVKSRQECHKANRHH